MLELYINFKGEAKEAIAFYEDVFDTKCQNLMTFGEAPEDPEHPINDEIKDLVMNASIIIEGTYVMISDVPDMFGFVGGFMYLWFSVFDFVVRCLISCPFFGAGIFLVLDFFLPGSSVRLGW